MSAKNQHKNKFHLNDYLTSLKFSNKKHLLVEGSDDKWLFTYLFTLLDKHTYNVVIDTAEILVGFDKTLGNREKVELVCRRIATTPYTSKIVGFVDREYRGFQLDEDKDIEDTIGQHSVAERLVWSRGHSIENYFFDVKILRKPITQHTTTHLFSEVFDLYNRMYDSILRLACAIGLAGSQWKHSLNAVKGSIGWNLFRVEDTTFVIDKARWRAILTNKQNHQHTDAEQLLMLFDKWYKRVEKADLSLVHWLCHGHIGFKVLWEAYAVCLVEICNKHGEDANQAVKKFHSESEEVKFRACTTEWAEKIVQDACVYPSEVFRLLEVM